MLYVFYGEETFVPAQKVAKITASFDVHNPAVNTHVQMDCRETCDVAMIVSALTAQNLFVSDQLIIIRDFFSASKAEEQKVLLACLKNYRSNDTVVFWDTTKPRKNGALFAWLQKNANEVVLHENLDGSALTQWVEKFVRDNDGKIDTRARDLLITTCGNDLWSLSNEMRKLLAYVDGRAISTDDISLLVSLKVSANMFETIESLAKGNTQVALNKLHTQLRAGDDAYQILGMYAYQLRSLLSVAGYFHGQNVSDKYVIAKDAKLHPFVVEKALSIVRHLTQKKLTDAHTRLLTYDRDIKMGRIDIHTALDQFVVEF